VGKCKLSGPQFATYLGYLEGKNNLLGEKFVAPQSEGQPQNVVILQKIYVKSPSKKRYLYKE